MTVDQRPSSGVTTVPHSTAAPPLAREYVDREARSQVRRVHEPLHPALTHFPIALWTMTLVCDVLSHWYGNQMIHAAYYCVIAGTVTAFLAAVAGLFDLVMIPAGREPRGLGIIHAFSMLALTMVFVVNIVLHRGLVHHNVVPIGIIIFTGLGLGGVFGAALLGHYMVFDYGANVRMHRRTA